MAAATPDLRFQDVQHGRGAASRVLILTLALLTWASWVYWLVTGAKGNVMDVAMSIPLGVIFGIYLPLDALYRRIEIRVQGDVLELRRLVPLDNWSRRISLATIVGAEVASVYPVIDRTPWATGRTDHRGVRLRLRGGEYVFISTPRAEDLAAALRTRDATSIEAAAM